MDSLFDEISRSLAHPHSRRATLRVVFRSAAGAAIVAFLPGKALAWANACGTDATGKKVFCPAGQVCCNAATNSCCASSACLNFKTIQGEKVCCPTGRACGGLCCTSAQTCCSIGTSSACCDSVPMQTCNTSTGAAVCVTVTPPPPPPTGCPGGCASDQMCVGGTCVCDDAKCTQQIGFFCNPATNHCEGIAPG